MQFDLNCLLEEICTWKNVIKNKDEKIESLENQIQECKQHIENIDTSNSTLLQEVAHQNSIISSLYQSLSIVDKTEADTKNLVEEIKKLKFNFKEQEKLYLNENNELKKLIEKLEIDHKAEIGKKITEIENNVSIELEKCAVNIQEKENFIHTLKEEISKIKHEKDQTILKIQIECEEKIGRMKSKISKNKGIHHHDFKSNDFFRQKFIEKEKEAKEEAAKLKTEIESLKREIDLLKSNNIFCDSTQRADSMRREIYCMSEKSNHPHEEYPPIKRTKIKENSPSIDASNNSYNVDRPLNNLTMCNYTSSSIRKTDVAPSFKKKLFNLDTNYFNK